MYPEPTSSNQRKHTMPREKKVFVYEFDELSDKAKEKAREWFRVHALEDEWWDSVYEDAAQVGLEITSFDLDRGRSITGKLTNGAEHCAKAILREHGDSCDSHKLAQAFLEERRVLDGKLEAARDEDEQLAWKIDNQITELEEQFQHDILEDYLSILQEEADYRLSDEAVDEDIRANEYTFLANGKRE
jgi:hypothetical protein